jgi:integrase family protein
MKISKAFNMYRINVLQARGFAQSTIANYEYTALSLIRFFGDIPLRRIKIADIAEWRAYIGSSCCSDTVGMRASHLRRVLQYLKKHRYRVLDYSEIELPKRAKAKTKYLTAAEIEEFIDVVGRRCRGYSHVNRLRNVAIVRLLATSGVRVGELCALNRDDIRDGSFEVVGKSKDSRLCFVNSKTLKAIDEYLALRTDDLPALFLSNQGPRDRITTDSVRRIFFFACLNSRFEDITPHTIRHSFATKALDRGIDIRYVGEMLGHQNINTTKRYTHCTNTKLQQLHAQAML